MEARVAKLEAAVDYVKTDVTSLRTDMRVVRDRLARLEERVTHLPTKGWGVAAIVILITVFTALVVLAPKLQALVGVAR